MITKEEFIKLISDQKKWDDRLDEVEKILNYCPLNMDWVEHGARLFDTTLNILFEEEAVDDINWWLFEKPMLPPGSGIWDEDGNEIPTETIEDLWNIVKEYRK